MQDNTPVAFTFPDASSPCVAIKMGRSVPGGVGPEPRHRRVQHAVHPYGLSGDATTRTRARFRCGCHFSTFDAEMGGQMICGQATENLPQVVLEYNDKNDSVTAVAIEGLIYGRQSNLL